MTDIGHEPRLEPKEYNAPICPCCRSECQLLFLDINGDICACDECWEPGTDFDTTIDAWEAKFYGYHV